MAHTHKLIDGIKIDLTAEEKNEIALRETEWNNNAFNRAMEDLRTKRNNLLADTDYLALSDQTLSTEMTTYRQSLRDITNNLTTKAQVDAVTFPTKPGA
jgi:hypothetical protein